MLVMQNYCTVLYWYWNSAQTNIILSQSTDEDISLHTGDEVMTIHANKSSKITKK